MEMQAKIDRYILNRMTDNERADFEIEMHNDPLLKEKVELEQAIVTQIRSRAYVDQQIKWAKEELHQEKFERYTLKQMDNVERTAFEKELENNTLLKDQLELEQAIVGQVRIKAFVNEQVNTAKSELRRGKTIRLTIYSVISIAAMFILFFFVHGAWQQQRFDQLYASNFSAYTNDYIVTDGVYKGDSNIDSVLVKSMLAYEKHDFTLAETQFDQILLAKDNPEIRFFKALAQLEKGNLIVGIATLQMLYNQPKDFRYYEQIRWYLALVHLKLHHKTETKKYLNELIRLEGVYWDKAKELSVKL
jgi:hypothetical protein